MSETYTGAVLWRGASQLDGAPIMVCVAGLAGSRNRKTGADMAQLYILRADMAPLAAVLAGADASICGDCMHRGARETRPEQGDLRARIINRTCYVNLAHGPRVVYELASAGRYQHVDLETGAEILAGRLVRLGAYGDPAAVPFYVWQALLHRAAGHTGYTHQWARFPELAALCMASVDSANEQAAARMLGFRTFRVRTASETLAPSEIACPASAEAGTRTQCDACRLCGGRATQSPRDIVIIAHGTLAGRFEAARDRAILEQFGAW